MENGKIIGFFILTYLFTCIDASYTVHQKMCIDIGGVISMGYGMLHYRSSKKNMNSKISNGVELIRSSEYVSLKCMNGYVSVSTRI